MRTESRRAAPIERTLSVPNKRLHSECLPDRVSSIAIFACAVLLCGALPRPCLAAGDPSLQNLPPEYDLSTVFSLTGDKAAADITFDRIDAVQEYDLKIGPRALILERLESGKPLRLAEAPLPPVGGSSKITVQRRAGKLSVLLGNQLVMDLEDAARSGGSADAAGKVGASLSGLRLQPVEPVYFSDDFMRQPNEAGEWTYSSGKWTIQTAGIAERGANPFSLEATPSPTGLAYSGYHFWKDYVFEAAAKGSDGTSFGICACLQDEQNYYLLRWSSGAQGALEIVRVADGAEAVLARRSGGFIPGLWYGLALRISGERLFAEVDHQPILWAQDSTFGTGKIGLYSSGDGNKLVWFDSVLVRPGRILYDRFGAPKLHQWDIQSEKALGGNPDWRNYTVNADVVDTRKGGGLAFRVRDSLNYYVLSWNSTDCSLIAVVNGQHHTLAEASKSVAPGKPHSITAGADDGYLWGAIDGRKVVEALDFNLKSGRAGFQPPRAAGERIRSIVIQAPDPPDPTDVLTAEFTNVDHHKEMRGWAGPLNAWAPAGPANDSGYWHKGSLYGDTTLRIPLDESALRSGKFTVVLNGDGKDPASGYSLDYSAASTGIVLSLLRKGQQVATSQAVTLPGPTSTLEIHRAGSFIFARLGGEVVIRYADPHPVDGYSPGQPLDLAADDGGHSKMGFIPHSETAADMSRIQVSNDHVYAETYHLAPINWRPQSGDWSITRRWACQPGWTWYGGKDTGYAVNWYKTSLWGDQSIDVYTGAMMAAEANAGNEAWRDLNCSFCSDGVNLFSGYTLIVQGWNGTVTRLFRKGRAVAESTQFQFPPQNVAHRLWFDVHVEKTGGNLKVVVSYFDEGGENHIFPLIEWTDPDPLPGGFLGYWTYDNGMMLARTVICSQQAGSQPLYASDPIWLAQASGNTPYPGSSNAGAAAKALAQVDLTAFSPTGVPPVARIAALPTPLPVPGVISPPAKTAQVPSAGPTAIPDRPTSPKQAPVIQVQNPTDVQAHGIMLNVDASGMIHSVRFRGHEMLRRIEMEIRTIEWRQVKMTPENTRVTITGIEDPQIAIEFHLKQPDHNIDIEGKETITLLPGPVLRVGATVRPHSSFESKRVSVNLVLPSVDYERKSFAVSAAESKNILVPAEATFPILFAKGIRRLTFPDTGIVVRSLAGAAQLEDLRHYQLGEFWYEDAAPYSFPHVPQDVAGTMGMEVQFIDPLAFREQ